MGKRIRVYAIVDVPDDFNLSDDVAALFAPRACVHFAAARPGVTAFFLRLGASLPEAIDDGASLPDTGGA